MPQIGLKPYDTWLVTAIKWARDLNYLLYRLDADNIPALSETVKHTKEGGLAVEMTNRTGATTVKGSVVSASTTYEDAFILQNTEYDSFGVVYDNGVADGNSAWVVVSGKADVLLQDATASIVGNWVRASTDDGRAVATDPSTGIGALVTADHFREIGHCIQNTTQGTDRLARVVLHFN